MSRHSSKVPVICAECEKTFLVPPCRIKKGCRFCSPACGYKNKTSPLIDRFFLHVGKKQPNGCIPWIAFKDGNGYGLISIGSHRSIVASRASYILFVGDIPNGLHVLHRCDNPSCVNPTHLFLGTNLDNIKDKISKNRQTKGSLIVGSKLNEDSARKIRHLYSLGGTSYMKLADQFGVTGSNIQAVIERRTWKHV